MSDWGEVARDWQVVRDRTGYYRAMTATYSLRPEMEETCMASGLTYNEASRHAMELYQVEEVMGS